MIWRGNFSPLLLLSSPLNALLITQSLLLRHRHVPPFHIELLIPHSTHICNSNHNKYIPLALLILLGVSLHSCMFSSEKESKGRLIYTCLHVEGSQRVKKTSINYSNVDFDSLFCLHAALFPHFQTVIILLKDIGVC